MISPSLKVFPTPRLSSSQIAPAHASTPNPHEFFMVGEITRRSEPFRLLTAEHRAFLQPSPAWPWEPLHPAPDVYYLLMAAEEETLGDDTEPSRLCSFPQLSLVRHHSVFGHPARPSNTLGPATLLNYARGS
jgi:hypothetical protein